MASLRERSTAEPARSSLSAITPSLAAVPEDHGVGAVDRIQAWQSAGACHTGEGQNGDGAQEDPDGSSEQGDYGDVEDNDGVQEHDFADSLSNSTVGLMMPNLRNTSPTRAMSIAFARDVTLDDGRKMRIGKPMPRSGSWLEALQRRSESDHALSAHLHRTHSDTETDYFDRRTGTPIGKGKSRQSPVYKKGEMRHPLLQATVDDLASNESNETLTMVHGDKGDFSIASPNSPCEDIPSPPSEGLASSIATSPVQMVPIVEQAASWLPRRTASRSRSYRSDMSSTSSIGRRRSTRSNTSMSPAHSFLGAFSPRSDPLPLEPDAEGQEIGHSKYIIGKQIGYGGFSVIKEAFTLEGRQKVKRAVKIVRKQIDGQDDVDNDKLQSEFDHEVSIWRYLHHPHILPLIEVHDTDFATFCITRLNEGGTLFDLVRSRRHLPREAWGLSADLAKRYSYQLASALRYLHKDMRIVHRDVKLENCLLDLSSSNAEDEGGNLLLCDFGLADYLSSENRRSPSPQLNDPNDHQQRPTTPKNRKFGPSETSTSIMGSLNYVAPEVLSADYPLYSPSVDIWAFGVILYALLTGDLPFTHEFQPRLILMIQRGEWDVRPLVECVAIRDSEGDEGRDAVELVKGCLCLDARERWDVEMVLGCSWLISVRDESDL